MSTGRVISRHRRLYTSDHAAFRDPVREFLRRHVLPHTERFITERRFPRELWLEAGKQGSLGLEIAEEYGGSSAEDYRDNAVLTEDLASVSGALVSCPGIQFDVVAPYLGDLTTPEQKSRWLPRLCAGELVAAIGMTEP